MSYRDIIASRNEPYPQPPSLKIKGRGLSLLPLLLRGGDGGGVKNDKGIRRQEEVCQPYPQPPSLRCKGRGLSLLPLLLRGGVGGGVKIK